MSQGIKNTIIFFVIVATLVVAYVLIYPGRGVDVRTGGQRLYGDQLFILSPQRGDTWPLMSRHTIEWDSHDIRLEYVLEFVLEGPTPGVIAVIDGDAVQSGSHTWNVRGVLNDGKPKFVTPGTYRLIGNIYDGEICTQSSCTLTPEEQGTLIASYKSGRFEIAEQ